MFIRKVTVEAFASYEELKMDQELDKGCNLILGKNGSGKSNFLQAIIFALGSAEDFKSKSKQEKRKFLHEGVSARSQAAASNRDARSQANKDSNVFSVEVVLDNQKRLIPAETDQLAIKRTYNVQTDRDEYFLNGSHINAKQLQNLLESGGFSCLSPGAQNGSFQIIRQGEVQDLANKGEEGFLRMLQRVAGTSLFDEKLEKIGVSLGEAYNKKETLNKTLEDISDKLQGLEADKEAYKDVEIVEQKKKACQRALLSSKIDANNNQIQGLRAEKQQIVDAREVLIDAREATLEASGSVSDQVQSLQQEMQAIQSQIDMLTSLRVGLTSQVANLNKSQVGEDTAQAEQLLMNLQSSIQHLQSQVDQTQQKSDKLNTHLHKIAQSKSALGQEKDMLAIKKQTAEELKNPAMRKKFIESEVAKVNVQKASLTKDLGDFKKQQNVNQTQVTEALKAIQANHQDEQQLATEIQQAQSEVTQAFSNKKQVAHHLKQHLFSNTELVNKAANFKAKLKHEFNIIDKVEPGYASLRRVMDQAKLQGLQGLHGLLIDFIECAPQVNCVVDIAGRQKLFTVIVDTMETAQQVLKLNRQLKGGVLNIYPLDSVVQEPASDLPKATADVTPLLTYIKLTGTADQRLKSFLHSAFKKYALVTEYKVALTQARENGLHCITPDLQIVYAGAFLTKVGSRPSQDQSHNRVSTYLRIRQHQLELDNCTAQLSQSEQVQADLNQRDLEALRMEQRCEMRFTQIKQKKTTLTFQRGEIQQKQQLAESKLEQATDQIQRTEALSAQLQTQVELLNKQKSSKDQAFSVAEQERLLFVNKQLNTLNIQFNERRDEFQRTIVHREQLENTLRTGYLPTQKQLQDQIASGSISVDLNAKREESLQSLTQELQQTESQISSFEKEVSKKGRLLTALIQRANPSENASQTESESTLLELRQKTRDLEEVGVKIDELTRVNQDTQRIFDGIGRFNVPLFEDLSSKDASLQKQMMHQYAQELDKFPRKNRHSQEWYEKYHAKYLELKAKQATQEKTEGGIKDLIKQLELQKQRTLEENFKSMNQLFQDTFQAIVPSGMSELKLVKHDDHDTQKSNPTQFPDPTQMLKMNKKVYKGIKVNVNFNEVGQQDQAVEEGQTTGLSHLSGGQKTVVVVALIFAVLRMEAAPFYILDEFDHALDGPYRQAIAHLVSTLSAKSQFLITTFKPELIETNQKAKIFEVSFANRKSKIGVIDKEKALQIINSRQESMLE